MNCLHHVVRQTLALGWNHHIQGLMILGNFFLIAGIRPQETLRWYLEMYVDAYDWVMAANSSAWRCTPTMDTRRTKPDAATSTYIRKMSNYSRGRKQSANQPRTFWVGYEARSAKHDESSHRCKNFAPPLRHSHRPSAEDVFTTHFSAAYRA